MTILLTGASGFVGMNILEQLVGAGRSVVALANTELVVPKGSPLNGAFAFERGDVRDRAAIESVLRTHRVSQIIHGAAITSDTPRERSDGDAVMSVNLGGTATMATAAARHGVERFMLVGSVAVYGSREEPGPPRPEGEPLHVLTEEQRPDPISLYDISKAAAETVLARIATLNDMDWRVGRLGVVFGPWERDTGFRDTMSPIHQLNRLAAAGGRARLDRPAAKNWQYSRDAARALVTLLDADAPRHHIYNLGPPTTWTLADWCEKLAARHPAFSFGIADGHGTHVETFEPEDAPILSWQRFTAEFGPTARFDLDAAFDDYFSWLDREAPKA